VIFTANEPRLGQVMGRAASQHVAAGFDPSQRQVTSP